MKNATKGAIIKGFALCIDVGAPLAATLTQFPVWVERSAEATMSGLCLIFLMLSALPFLKQLKAYFKSPSACVVWGLILLLLVLLRNIIDQILVVSFVGLVANVFGAGLYFIGKCVAAKKDKEKEVNKDESGTA